MQKRSLETPDLRDTIGVATIHEVTARAGVSKATVSRVMNGITSKVSVATRQRLLEVVSKLGYQRRCCMDDM